MMNRQEGEARFAGKVQLACERKRGRPRKER